MVEGFEVLQFATECSRRFIFANIRIKALNSKQDAEYNRILIYIQCDFFENFLDFLLQTGKGYVMRVNDFKNEVKITPLLTPINALTATIVINRENSTRQ